MAQFDVFVNLFLRVQLTLPVDQLRWRPCPHSSIDRASALMLRVADLRNQVLLQRYVRKPSS